MISLLQRVTQACVDVDGKRISSIESGLLVLVGFEPDDDERILNRMLERLLAYRVFSDQNDRMNLSLQDVQGGLLLVPQFTLAADTHSGNRPGFSTAAAPEKGRSLFDDFINRAKKQYSNTQTGIFGANMQLTLTNDGPVTFSLHVH